jgi:hypothetical protein
MPGKHFLNIFLEKAGKEKLDRSRGKKDLSHGIHEDRNILRTIKRRKTNWTAHILRRKLVIEENMEKKIEVMRRRGRRNKQLRDAF